MRTWVRYLFIVLSVSLAAGCVEKGEPRRSAAPATTAAAPPTRVLPPLPSRPLSARLRAIRARAMNDAAMGRGLAWKSDVGMTALSGWEYGTRTKEVAEMLGGEDLKTLGHLGVAGGVLPEGTDLATAAVSFAAASADATYSPLDKQVLLLGDESSPEVVKDNSLLTHEFVHALQDQHFDLLPMLLARPYNFDRTEAVFALIEGDAMSVQRRLEGGEAWTRRPLNDIARQEDERFGEYRRLLGPLFPPLLTETFIFRYRDGLRFIEAVRRSRPARNLNQLFLTPPVSSEQVIHPEKYFAGEMPREVRVNEDAFTSNGWRLTTSTPLGEIGVRGLLLAGVQARDAARASAGWGGDRAYLFDREGTAPVFVWKTVWDAPAEAVEFFNAYNAVCRRNGNASASESASGDASQTLWRKNGRLTLVRRDGDTVLVIRGAEADVQAALQLVR